MSSAIKILPYYTYEDYCKWEVLSPSTAMKDRNNKFFIYQQQKVKYYIIIDPETNTVEVYVHNGEKYVLDQHNETYHFSFPQNCTAEINFSAIWE